MKNNQYYKHNATVTVPYTNKKLDITFETFRNKLYPGQKEEWKLKIAGKNGDKIAAEMLAGLYDASLDKFVANSWPFNIYNHYYAQLNWNAVAFSVSQARNISYGFYKSTSMPYRRFDNFNWFGFSYYSSRYYELDYYDDEGGVADQVVMVENVEEEESEEVMFFEANGG